MTPLHPKRKQRYPKHLTASRHFTFPHMLLRSFSFPRMLRSRSKHAPLSMSATPLLDLDTARSRHRTTPMVRSSAWLGNGMRSAAQGPEARVSYKDCPRVAIVRLVGFKALWTVGSLFLRLHRCSPVIHKNPTSRFNVQFLQRQLHEDVWSSVAQYS